MPRLYMALAAILAASTVVSIAFAVTPPPTAVGGTESVAVSLPSPPPSLAPLNLPWRNVFRPALSDSTTSGAENFFSKNNLGVSEGLVGVYLDGDNSTASILDNTGIVNVDLHDKTYHGIGVRSIALDRVVLDDGTVIHRGIAPNNGSGLAVPAIVGTPGTSEAPNVNPQAGVPSQTLQTQPFLQEQLNPSAPVPQQPSITPEPDPADSQPPLPTATSLPKRSA